MVLEPEQVDQRDRQISLWQILSIANVLTRQGRIDNDFQGNFRLVSGSVFDRERNDNELRSIGFRLNLELVEPLETPLKVFDSPPFPSPQRGEGTDSRAKLDSSVSIS